MSNYTHTTAAGTSRRRAKSITINNPAQPLSADTTAATPSVTFVMEDRIIMADGSETFIPAGNLIINLDSDTLAKQYPSIDVDTGAVDEANMRLGAQIMQTIMDALEDVFITEGMARDEAVRQA